MVLKFDVYWLVESCGIYKAFSRVLIDNALNLKLNPRPL